MSVNKIKEKQIKYLGIDWGEKRIGLAIGDSETRTAIPHKIVEDIDNIVEIINKEEINKIIIGLPIKMDEKKSISYEKAKKFINQLKNKIRIPIETVDERLTSKAADALVGDKKTKAEKDAISAMFILQSYLDKIE